MQLRATFFALGAGLLASKLGGCVVYVPMQAAAPAIRTQGELEVTTHWSLTNRLEAAATYSPTRHLLVRAAGSTKGSQASNASASCSQSNQYELGAGIYWPVASTCWWAGCWALGRPTPRHVTRTATSCLRRCMTGRCPFSSLPTTPSTWAKLT